MKLFNYFVVFFPYISSLKDFLFELLIYVLFESMGLTRNCVCLSYSLGLNHDFEENYISSTTMKKENACDLDSNKKSAILVIVLANEKPGHESENETS